MEICNKGYYKKNSQKEKKLKDLQIESLSEEQMEAKFAEESQSLQLTLNSRFQSSKVLTSREGSIPNFRRRPVY